MKSCAPVPSVPSVLRAPPLTLETLRARARPRVQLRHQHVLEEDLQILLAAWSAPPSANALAKGCRELTVYEMLQGS
eukprot:3591197-Rhodomonas_salina.1